MVEFSKAFGEYGTHLKTSLVYGEIILNVRGHETEIEHTNDKTICFTTSLATEWFIIGIGLSKEVAADLLINSFKNQLDCLEANY